MISPILAISKNTFQEAIRSRVFIICLAILIILSVFMPMFPSLDNPISRLKLALSLSLQLCYAFGLLILIFTSAALIPDDIQSRRIYTILPKSVTRVQYIIGKSIGIFSLAFCLLLSFALIVILYVRLTYYSMDIENQKNGRKFFSVINPYSLKNLKRYRNNKLVGDVPSHALEAEIINFKCDDYDNRISLKFLASYLNYQNAGNVVFDLEIVDPISNDVLAQNNNVIMQDKKTTSADLTILKKFEGSKNAILRILVAKASRPYVGGVLVKPENIYVHRKPQSFELNIFKVFFVIACQLALLGFIALSASTRISFYISAFFALTVFAAGSFRAFLQDYISEKQFKIDNKAIDINTWYFKISTLSENYMLMICNLMPDFSKYDIAKDLVEGIALNTVTLQSILSNYLLYFAVYLFIAVCLFWRREV